MKQNKQSSLYEYYGNGKNSSKNPKETNNDDASLENSHISNEDENMPRDTSNTDQEDDEEEDQDSNATQSDEGEEDDENNSDASDDNEEEASEDDNEEEASDEDNDKENSDAEDHETTNKKFTNKNVSFEEDSNNFTANIAKIKGVSSELNQVEEDLSRFFNGFREVEPYYKNEVYKSNQTSLYNLNNYSSNNQEENQQNTNESFENNNRFNKAPNAIEETRALLDNLKQQNLLPPTRTCDQKNSLYDKNYDYHYNHPKTQINREIEEIRQEGEIFALDAMNLAGKLKEQEEKLRQRKEKWKKQESVVNYEDNSFANNQYKNDNTGSPYSFNHNKNEPTDYNSPISSEEILVEDHYRNDNYDQDYIPKVQNYRSLVNDKREYYDEFANKEANFNNGEDLHRNNFMQKKFNEGLQKNNFNQVRFNEDLDRGSALTNMSEKVWNGLNDQVAAGTWYNNNDTYENQQRPSKFLQEKISNFAGNNYSVNNSKKKV